MNNKLLLFLGASVPGISTSCRTSIFSHLPIPIPVLVSLALVLSVSQLSFAQNKMTEDFENHVPNHTSSRPFNLDGSNDAKISKNYSKSGSKSLKSEIPLSPAVSNPRSEIQHKGWTGSPKVVMPEHKFFTVRTFGFSFLFPKDFQEDPLDESLMQWKNDNDPGCNIGFPGFSIRLRGSQLQYNIKYGKDACKNRPKTKAGNLNSNIKKGVWHNIVVEIYNDYRESGGDGYVKIWYNEGGNIDKKKNLKVHYKGAVGYKAKNGPFLKLGMYKSLWKSKTMRNISKRAGVTTREMYIDDVFIIEGTYDGSSVSKGKPKGDPPTADAGKDKTITLPDDSITIQGEGSGEGITYRWEKVSGPDATIKNKNKAQLEAEDLEEGTYVFKLTVTDEDGRKATDEVKVKVKPEEIDYDPPTADAGKDVTITLPENSVTIQGTGDSDAGIESYKWDKVSGPNSTVKKPYKAQLEAEDLQEGTYVFKLTVTANDGQKDSDEVKITVKAEAIDYDPPTADAGKDVTITLPENSVTIQGTGDSDAGIESYKWDKVSGPNSTVKKPYKAQLEAEDLQEGTYVFKLTVTANDGQKDSDEVKITVKAEAIDYDPPTADAGKDVTITLPDNTVTIQGTGDSDAGIESYKWDKVSGPNSTVKKPYKAQLEAEDLQKGTYVFKLTVTANDGQKDSDEVKITVKAEAIDYDPPTADAGKDVTITLPENSVTIQGTGDSDAGIESYKWDKVSGPNSTVKKPYKAQLEAEDLQEGTYVFKLTVTANDGQKDSDEVKITVKAEAIDYDPPTADAGKDVTITLPDNTVTIQGTGDSDAGIESYKWDKVSGPNSTVKKPYKAQLVAEDLEQGTYVFELTVTTGDGQKATDQVKITVKPENNQVAQQEEEQADPPTADAGKDVTITLPENSVTIQGTGDSDAGIESYKWDKVSGPNSTVKKPYKAQLVAEDLEQGTYVFELTVTAGDGQKATDQVKITVKPENNQVAQEEQADPPTADAGKDVTITLPDNTVTIQGSGTGVDLSYRWNKVTGPNSSVKNLNKAQLVAEDLEQGTYVFELTVTAGDGQKATDQVKITVKPENNQVAQQEEQADPPTADAGKDITITLPDNTVTIQGSGTGVDLSYRWNKVTGPNSSVKNLNKAQLVVEDLEQGTYVFELTVTAGDGQKATDQVKITVKPENNQVAQQEEQADPPTADAGKDVTITLPDNTVTIQGSGTGVDLSYRWNKVTGPNSSVKNLNKAQLVAEDLEQGTYVFELTVTAGDGQKATDQVKITVKPENNQVAQQEEQADPPTADAGKDITITLPDNTVTIQGSGTGVDLSYRWNKVTGPNSSVKNLNKAQLVAEDLEQGTYVFELTVTAGDGQKATDRVRITVKPEAGQVATVQNDPPTADAGDDMTVTLPKTEVKLNGTAEDPDGTIASYQWKQVSGPEGITIAKKSSANAQIKNLKEGTYVFQLRVTDNKGATHIDKVELTVLSAVPTLSATVTDAMCKSDNGSIALKIAGGTAPFKVKWSNGDTGKKLNDLATGEYKAQVTDTYGRSVSKTFTVSSTAANLQVNADIKDATCSQNNGSIKVQASGGTGPYNYQWSTNGRSSSLQQLSAGSYSVIVSDQNGCRKKFSFEVGVNESALSLDIRSEVNNSSCAGDDGSISLQVDGGNTPYSFVWAHGATGPELKSLSHGNYKVTIADEHGCFTEASYLINEKPGPPKPEVVQSGDSLMVTDPAISYQWYKDSVMVAGATDKLLRITEAGAYSVQVTNELSCVSTSDFFYAEDPPLFNQAFTFRQVEFYPNPAPKHIKVRILLNQPAATSVSIYDFMGRELLYRDLGVATQVFEEIPLDRYPAGTYLIRAKADDEIITQRFIKP